jgi:hydroxymethylbilane synthase
MTLSALIPEFLTLGTRDSQLAMVQTNLVLDAIEARLGTACRNTVQVVSSKAMGDRELSVPLATLGVKTGQYGVFVKELEQALLKREIDLAVHSMKDMPSALPDGLIVSPVLERDSVADVLIAQNRSDSFWTLPAGAVVGTSSLRRTAQLKRLRADIQVVSIRGNVQTRLQKLDDGMVDALVLAEAGVNRLGLQAQVSYRFNPETELLPAPCQGVLGVETRVGDETIQPLLAVLHNPTLAKVVWMERTVMQLLEGGCQLPLGAYAQYNPEENTIALQVQLLSPINVALVAEGRLTLSSTETEASWLPLLTQFCHQLLASGGDTIKQQVRLLQQ